MNSPLSYTDEDTEIIILMELEFEVRKCEANHSPRQDSVIDLPVRPCSVEAVAVKTITCTGESFPICLNSVLNNMDVMALGYLHHCLSPVSECWKVDTI
jgi:hypothetical protein